MTRSLILLWLRVLPVFAQISPDPSGPDLTGFKYPALAKSARIQGTVEFRVESGQIKLAAGHPMLVAVARANLERWAGRLQSDAQLSVNYRFHLVDLPTKEVDEPIGNGFERLFLRLLRRPVSRKVLVCVYSDDPAPSSKITREDRDIIEIDIQGGVAPCLQTNTSYLARAD